MEDIDENSESHQVPNLRGLLRLFHALVFTVIFHDRSPIPDPYNYTLYPNRILSCITQADTISQLTAVSPALLGILVPSVINVLSAGEQKNILQLQLNF